MSEQSLCPCGSSKVFEDCCAKLHSGQRQAQTAEQLMRSRYSAFYCHNADYLQCSHHPSTRQSFAAAALNEDQWLQLTIIDSQHGSAVDTSGTVEFVACYSPVLKSGAEPSDRQLLQLHEVSNFVRQRDRWFYLDGEIITSGTVARISWNRNNPCWCGSAKKFKKCHG